MMKCRCFSIFIFVIILAVFSFWPSIIDAHYRGLISCPIISVGSMADCSGIAAHIAKIISHIADFMLMIVFVLPLAAVVAFILQSVRNRYFLKNFISALKSKIAFYANFQKFLISEIKTNIFAFIALQKGILNTKVF